MAKFTREEIEAEHRRRRPPETTRQLGAPKAQCIHCGQPFDTTTAVAGAYGLCDDCNLKD